MLRSLTSHIGNRNATEKNVFGNVYDFVINITDWKIDVMITKYGMWWSKKLCIHWKYLDYPITAVNLLRVKMTNEQVKNFPKKDIPESPGFDPPVPINEVIEKRIFDYYGKPFLDK